jgi:hypothetical protein
MRHVCGDTPYSWSQYHTAVTNEVTAAYETEETPDRKITSHPSSW